MMARTLALLSLLVLALHASPAAAQSDPTAAEHTGLELSVRGGFLAHTNAGAQLVTMPAAGVGAGYWITPELGVLVAYDLAHDRRGAEHVWTLQLHHYARALVAGRLRVAPAVALFAMGGLGVIVEQHAHHAESSEVWATRAEPTLALSLGVDVRFGPVTIRFSADASIGESFADAGGALALVIPIPH